MTNDTAISVSRTHRCLGTALAVVRTVGCSCGAIVRSVSGGNHPAQRIVKIVLATSVVVFAVAIFLARSGRSGRRQWF